MTRELITRDDPSSDRLGLFAVTAATDNDRGSFACSDSGSYGVVLDAGLQFRFPPIPLGGPQSASHAFPFRDRDTSGVLVLTFHNRRPDNKIDLNFFSLGGEKLGEQRSDLFTGTPRIRLIQEDVLLTGPSGRDFVIARVDPDLTLREEHRFKERHVGVIPANLDGDEPTEFLVTNAMDQEISILQDKFSKPVRVRIPGNIPAGPLVTIRQRNEQETQVYLHGDGGFLLLGYAKNPLHPFRFAIYTFYYLLIFGILSLLQRILSYNNRMKSKREKELLDYQLQSVMNQLSPHYTFNALNAIGDAVREGRSEEAYEYFTTLAGLIRRSMTHATQPYSTLGEELGFVTEYLEIEDYRFRDKLSWHLHLYPEINLEIPVPKMLIHIFVENALKHGIFHLKEKGRIELDLRRDNRAITITIRDNGVGFAEARRLEGRVGDGLRIFDNYLEIYNTQNLHRITYTISDLKSQGQSGTLVEIRVRDPVA
ncbi:MAG: histidine kinase [Bacteroidales bacterium]